MIKNTTDCLAFVKNEQAIEDLRTALSPFVNILTISKLTRRLPEAKQIVLSVNLRATFIDQESDYKNLIQFCGLDRLGIVVFLFPEKKLSQANKKKRPGFLYLIPPFTEENILSFIRDFHIEMELVTKIRDYNQKMYAKVELAIRGKFVYVDKERIIKVEVHDNECNVYYLNSINVVCKETIIAQLTYWSGKLDSDYFIKIGKNILVNKKYWSSWEEGVLELQVTYNGMPLTVNVPDHFMAQLRKRFIQPTKPNNKKIQIGEN